MADLPRRRIIGPDDLVEEVPETGVRLTTLNNLRDYHHESATIKRFTVEFAVQCEMGKETLRRSDEFAAISAESLPAMQTLPIPALMTN